MSSLLNSSLIDRFGGQADLVRQLIQIYVDTSPGYIEAIDAGISGGDREKVAAAAHSLKGSSAEVGAERLAQLCQQLHTAAMNGENDSLAHQAKAVAECFSETTEALETLDVQ